ncbi:site-specific integrase [Telmatospirillum sp. J64-1]|uniref:tyrosine-type recombinase/integrase n=1 Tax=Telmatospirillum sp. J64-1 TaxID=2502183 RepID=UPI00163D739C|nr:site-specific integrase [Telmatospirillum sp. J64-1]
MTLDQALGRYWTEVSQHRASANDDFARMARLNELIGKSRLLSEITDNQVALFVAKRRGQKARYKDTLVAPGTVNRDTELLRRVFRRAKRVWKVEMGEEIDWSLHLLEEPDERVRELTAEEQEKLFKHLREDMRPMVEFAIMAGMRLANVIRLTWKQIDLQAGVITMKMKSSKPGGRIHTLPITPAMRVLLANQVGHHPIYVFTYVCEKSRQSRQKGERYPYSKDGWRKKWKDALNAADIEDFRFHDTRHTAATRTLRASGNLKVVQKMLGHTDIHTTARYAHAMHDDILAAMTAAQSRNSPEQKPQASKRKRQKA